MTLSRPTIAQLEFQLPFSGPFGRYVPFVAGDSRSKLVVRIHDLDGSLTRIVRQYETLERKRDRVEEACKSSRGMFRQLHSWRIRQLEASIHNLRTHALDKALAKLWDTLSGANGVAIEDRSLRPFRGVRHDETHEIREAAANAASIMIFIYPYDQRPLDQDSLGDAAYAMM